MAIPKDYQCDGQLNLWDYAASITSEPKPYEYDFERYVGQKVWCWLPEENEPQIGEIMSFDHYYTEVKVHYEYYALTNKNVKPCTLPTLEEAIELVTKKFGLEFETYHGEWNLPDNPTIYKHVFKKHSYIEISEAHYWSARGKDFQGARYIAVDWNGWHESTCHTCDDTEEIYRAVDNAIYRNEHAKKPKKGTDDGD